MRIRIFGRKRGGYKYLTTLTDNKKWIYSITFNNDDSFMAVASSDHTVNIYRVDRDKL